MGYYRVIRFFRRQYSFLLKLTMFNKIMEGICQVPFEVEVLLLFVYNALFPTK